MGGPPCLPENYFLYRFWYMNVWCGKDSLTGFDPKNALKFSFRCLKSIGYRAFFYIFKLKLWPENKVSSDQSLHVTKDPKLVLWIIHFLGKSRTSQIQALVWGFESRFWNTIKECPKYKWTKISSIWNLYYWLSIQRSQRFRVCSNQNIIFIKMKISCYEFAENQQPLVGYHRNRFKASLWNSKLNSPHTFERFNDFAVS